MPSRRYQQQRRAADQVPVVAVAVLEAEGVQVKALIIKPQVMVQQQGVLVPLGVVQ